MERTIKMVIPELPVDADLIKVETDKLLPYIGDRTDIPLSLMAIDYSDQAYLQDCSSNAAFFKLEHGDEELFSQPYPLEECTVTKGNCSRRKEAKEMCPKCHKYVSHMKKHSLVHSREKPFRCKFCPMAFSQKSNLNRHVKTIHVGSSVICPLCGKNLKRNDKLKLHLSKMHVMLNPAA